MILEIIQSRRSIRQYIDRPVAEEDLEYILEAGRYSQSGGNEQPWLFGVIDDKGLISELVKCCRGQKWINTAPVVLALCTRRLEEGDLEVEKYRLGKLKEEIYNIDPNALDILLAQEHQALIAVENITLAAREKGLGTCVVAYVDVYRASRVLQVPNSHLVTYLITLGYPGMEPGKREVKPLDEIVFHNTYR
jgi:nitroreductase